MKLAWRVAAVLCCLVLGAPIAAQDEEFLQLFARHQEAGTLLSSETARVFAARGWGKQYREALAERFQGSPVGGLRLEVSLPEGYRPQVGKKLALSFRLHNESDQPVTVTTGGTCKTVHEATAVVVEPAGKLIDPIGRGLVGGPHCFCSQRQSRLEPQSSVKLDTTVDDSLKVVTWEPKEPGAHVILGAYALGNRRIFSKPILVEVP
jgi:hypothetical protein